ncbi:MAG: histidine phosphatase family protein [Gimesia sp.]
MEPQDLLAQPDSNVTNLLLIRHGATPPNEQRPYTLQGCGINPSLSENGKKQAHALSEFLSLNSAIQHIYCSPMIRAKETAFAIGERFGLIPQEIAEIHECDVGQWEGKSWDIIMQENPEAYHAFMDDPFQAGYAGGESYRDVLDRSKPAIQSVLERHPGENVAIVAHNVVNRVYLANLMGMEIKRAREITQTNTGINIIRHKQGETKLVTMNAIFHLNGIPH